MIADIRRRLRPRHPRRAAPAARASRLPLRMLAGLLVCLFIFPLVTLPAQAGTQRIGTAAELRAALAAAGPGTDLRLAPGDYGVVVLAQVHGTSGQPVSLRSADPAHPARLTGLTLRDAEHVVLEGLFLDYGFSQDDGLSARPFQFLASQDIVLRKSVIDGDLAGNGNPTGFGLIVTGCDGVRIEDTEIRGFWKGLHVSQSSNVTVVANNIHSIRSDGLNFVEVRGVRIEGNYIHDFLRAMGSGDHADMIQFWTAGAATPSTDIVIRDNILSSGRGLYTQSIFMRNERVDKRQAGREMFYRNILIEENVILNGHRNGIVVGATDGLVIRNNTLVHNPASDGPKNNPPLWRPQITVAGGSSNVRIERNVAFGFPKPGKSGWVVAGNLVVQDMFRNRAGYYGAVFIPEVLSHPERVSSYRPLRRGPLDGTGVGAARLISGRLPAP